MGEVVKIAPTWKAAMRVYMMCLESGTFEGRKSAEAELLRVADIMDRLNSAAEEDAAFAKALAEKGIFQ